MFFFFIQGSRISYKTLGLEQITMMKNWTVELKTIIMIEKYQKRKG